LGLVIAVLHRLAVVAAGDVGHAAEGVEHQLGGAVVAVTSVAPEAGNRGHHQLWVHFAEGLIVQSQRRHDPGRVTLNQNVGVPDQIEERRPAAVRLEVEGHSPFIRVQVEEQAALFRMWFVSGEGTHPPGWVAAGPLDLDHVRPVVGQQLGAIGTGDMLGQVDDLDVLQDRVVHSAHGRYQFRRYQNLAVP